MGRKKLKEKTPLGVRREIKLTREELLEARLLSTERDLLNERFGRQMENIQGRMNVLSSTVKGRTGIDIENWNIDINTGLATAPPRSEGGAVGKPVLAAVPEPPPTEEEKKQAEA